jgi:two-component system, cell cycle sensor histidine kinase and response regulator CckA
MTTDFVPPGLPADGVEVSSEHFQQVQELSPDGFVMFRSLRNPEGVLEDFVCLYANPAAVAIVGSPAGSLQGTRLLALLPGKRVPEIFSRCTEVVETGRAWKGVFRYRRGGADNWFRATVVRLEDGFAASFSDITHRTRLEKDRAHKVALLESTSEGIYGVDIDGCFTFINSSAAKMLGYEREELLGRAAHPIIHHRRADGARYPLQECPVHHAIHSGESVRLFDEVLWRKDGTSFPVEFSSSPIVRGGEIEGAVVAFADIAALKQAEEALRLRALQQAAVAELGFHALAGRDIELLLRGATTQLRDTLDLEYTAYFEVLPDQEAILLREGSGWEEHQLGEARVAVAPDNHPGHTLLAGEPITVENFTTETRFRSLPLFAEAGIVSGLGVAVSSRDTHFGVLAAYTTVGRVFRQDEIDFLLSVANVLAQAIERKRAEEALRVSEQQFRQAQKMEAVGQLAGGVAHDFNNLLTVIKGNAELGLMDISPSDPLRELLDEIIRAAGRATDLTRQLLAFSRRQVLQPKVFKLNATISAMEKLLQRVIGENVLLRLALDPELHLIRADPGQLEQVLVNLVVNARDAMPKGGLLTIETANVVVDTSTHEYPTYVQPGTYVGLRAHDAGTGIDDETLPHLFEPFFTTKEPGQGTGLGLSAVYGIIKQSGGYVWANSVVGSGSTFTVLLPQVESAAPEADVATSRVERQVGLETVLLVEDEATVRNLTRRILERRGYMVLEAADVEEALNIYAHHRGPIHLALTDVILPGMSGRDLAERLNSCSPNTRVLYMSGYTADLIAQHGVLEPGIALLEKPFTPAMLLRRVREILDGGGAPPGNRSPAHAG